MRTLAPLFAVILTAVAVSGYAGEKKELFKYDSQLGVAEVSVAGDGCLTIPNASLRENQQINLIILDHPQKVVEKKIIKKLKASCSKNTETPPDAFYYSFPAGKERFGPTVAVVGSTGEFKVVNGKVRGDLNGDGALKTFRSCTSNEGLHLTVWDEEALKTKRLWHEYYYLGYDVESSCKPADYEE